VLAKLRSRVSYANVMATVAVFVALGGTSYAVANGSIDSREIKNNTVRSKDIRNNEVRSGDVRNQSLLAQDFAPGQLPAGPMGATGQQGATGPPGPPGPPGSGSNADTLDGLDSSQFQRVGLVQAGAANETEDQGFADVIRWDELATIQTDGDADSDGTVRVLNTGSHDFTVRALGLTSTQSPGGFTSPFSVSGGPTSILIWSADGARSWLVVCAQNLQADPDQIRCHGVANRVG
jgi:hypothetical protein